MPIEIDDRGLNIIGNNFRAVRFLDNARTERAAIYLDADNRLVLGDLAVSTGAPGGSALDLSSVPLLTLAATALLANERVLAPGALITATDGGAGGAYTLAVDSAKLAWASGKLTINGTASLLGGGAAASLSLPNAAVSILGGGASSSLTLPNAATSITGGGTLALGGFTLTAAAAASVAGTNTGDVTLAATNHGLALTGQVIGLGTPSSTTATSTNAVTTTTHTHAADATLARAAITLTAGSGLTGGGDLTANRTFAVGAGTLITVGTDTVGITPDTTDYGYIGSTTTPWTPTWIKLSTLAGAGLTHAAGVLAVGAGTLVTVGADTVGITPGASDYGYIGSTTTPWAAGWRSLSTLAGSGLTHAAGVLAVGAGTLITVAAESVGLSVGTAQYQYPVTGATPFTPAWSAGYLNIAAAKTLTVNDSLTTGTLTSGRVLIATAANTIGDDSGLTFDAATNALTVTGNLSVGGVASHLTPSATATYDLGTTVTRWRDLFLSAGVTAAGAVNAGSATISGALSVTTGNFTVGASVLQVNTSGSRVGINMAADAQFDLDVLGSFRAGGYIVGKHALQLPGALLIAHYDGPEPYATNYLGDPTGHKGQTATVADAGVARGVIYRPGKFGKAVQTGAATTNLFTDPSFENATLTNWTVSGTFTTNERSTEQVYSGAYSRKLVTGATGPYLYAALVVTAVSYTLSVRVRLASGSAVDASSVTLLFNSANATPSYASLGDGWYLLTYSGTGVAGTKNFGVQVQANQTVYVDAAQFEQVAYATPYCDGGLGAGHTWSGTPHASTSSRTVAYLSYPIAGNIEASAGSISLWSYQDTSNPNGGVLWAAGSTNGELDLYAFSSAVHLRINDVTLNAALSLSTWHHVVCTWDSAANEHKLYVDGVLKATGSPTTTPPTLHATIIGVGYSPALGTASTYVFPGLLDDFAILDRAMSDDEVRAVYESNAPVFAETSTFSWRNPKTTIWADESGLFGLTATGAAALALSTQTASLSWGGLTLAEGDFALGNTAKSWLWWDADGNLTMGGASATARVTLSGTDGSLLLGDSANEHVKITGTALEFKDGATVYTSLSGGALTLGQTAGEHVAISSTSVQIKDGATVYTDLTGGALTLGDSTNEHVIVNTSGVSLKDGATVYGQFAATTTIGATTGEHVAISSTSVQIKDGSTVYTDLTAGALTLGAATAENVLINSSGVALRDASTVYALFAATTTIGVTTTEHVAISSTSVQIKDGSTVYTDLTAGALVLGETANSKSRLSLSSGALNFITRSGAGVDVTKINVQADGDIFIGSDISAAATTYLSIFSNDQTYNAEALGAGDLLIGDNSASKANILWDKSAGKIQFRGGTTMQVEIGTDGKLYAGAGAVWLDSTGVSILTTAVGISGSEYELKFWNTARTGKLAQFYTYEGSSGVSWYSAWKTDGVALGHTVDILVEATDGAISLRPSSGNGVSVSTGLNVGSATGAATGAIKASAGIDAGAAFKRSGVEGYLFVPLLDTGRKTNVAFDGDTFSSTTSAKIRIDTSGTATNGGAASPSTNGFAFSAVVPKAVQLAVSIADTASSTTDCYILFGDTSTLNASVATVRCAGLANGKYASAQVIVPCDNNGDFYYQVAASGTNTATVFIALVGYFI